MTVSAINNSALCGAAAGMMRGRFSGSVTPSDYATVVSVAAAIRDEFNTVNTGSGAAIADGDNAQAFLAVYAAAAAALDGIGATDVTAADYLKYANQIYAQAKRTITNGLA